MPLFFRPLNVDIASLLLLSENSRSLFEMKSRHAVKQGLRCLHGVVCLKLWIHYSSNLVKRQQLRERGQEPIKTEYSRQGRFQQGMLHRNGFCLKILNFPKSRARKIERKTALLREQRQRDSKTDSGNQWSR